MKKSLILILLPLLLTAGCGKDNTPVFVEPSKDDLVIANCYTVQQAVEAFAAGNGGEYPVNIAVQPNLDGNTVLDLLPNGVYLTNPYTNVATEPTVGYGGWLGETAYSVTLVGLVPLNYIITGWGETDVIFQLREDGPVN